MSAEHQDYGSLLADWFTWSASERRARKAELDAAREADGMPARGELSAWDWIRYIKQATRKKAA